MGLTTTAYRRISRQPRTIFLVSRVMVVATLIAIALSCVLTVDLVARAPGLVVPTKATRPVAATIDGIVQKFHVIESQSVSAGDLLVTLSEPSIPLELAQLEQKLSDLTIERLIVTGQLYETKVADIAAKINATTIPEGEKEKWLSFLDAKITVREVADEEFAALEDQTVAEIDAYEKSIGIVEGLLDLYRDRNTKVSTMVERGIQNEFKGVDSLIQVRELEERLHATQSERVNRLHKLEQIKTRRDRFESEHLDEISTRLVEIDRAISQAETALMTLASRQSKLEIRAPIDGVIQEINSAALNQRAGGKTLLNLVPVQNGLQLIARIKNQDISHIRPGQSATLLFDAFPIAVYGTSTATVETVSEDVAGVSETIPIPAEVTDNRIVAVEQQATQTGLSYIATLQILEDDTSPIELRPGLSVLANIRTGEQRIISFLLNPLLRAWHSSLKEPV